MLSVIVRMPYRDGVLIRQTPSLVEVVRDHLGFPTWYVYSDGTMLRPIAGGSEPAPEPKPTPAAPAAGIPQDQVNAIVARETQAAQQKATNDLLAKLGYPTIEAAEEAAKAAKAAADALKSQQQRDADAAAEAKRAADADKADAARERHEAKVERALGKAGLDLDNETLTRAGLAAINLQPGADADAIKAAVDKLKTDAPQLFGTTTAPAGGTHTDPGQPRRTPAERPAEFGKDGYDAAVRDFGEDAVKKAESRWGGRGALAG